MTVDLTPVQAQELQRLAAEAKISPEEVVREAVSSYLRRVDSLTAAVREGEASAELDGWLTTDEVFERLNGKLLKTA